MKFIEGSDLGVLARSIGKSDLVLIGLPSSKIVSPVAFSTRIFCSVFILRSLKSVRLPDLTCNAVRPYGHTQASASMTSEASTEAVRNKARLAGALLGAVRRVTLFEQLPKITKVFVGFQSTSGSQFQSKCRLGGKHPLRMALPPALLRRLGHLQLCAAQGPRRRRSSSAPLASSQPSPSGLPLAQTM